MPVKPVRRSLKSEGGKQPKKKTNKKPVKKTVKKETERESATKKKTSRKMKSEVKKAVNRLPGLIIEQAVWTKPSPHTDEVPAKGKIETEKPANTPPPTPKNPVQNPRDYYKEQKSKQGVLWLIIIAFTSVILIMWGWNAYVSVQDIIKFKNKQPGLYEQTKQELQELLKETDEIDETFTSNNEEAKPDDIKQDIKEVTTKLKTNLAELLNQMTSSTSTTSTEEVIINSDDVIPSL